MRTSLLFVVVCTIIFLAYAALGGTRAFSDRTSMEPSKPPSSTASDALLGVATFAGGCFWCMQPPFDRTRGVIETIVGYTGGTEPNPSYELVTSGKTRYAEAVQVRFDPQQVTYRKLLEIFWKNIDPTQENGQFADRGPQYRTAIFFHNEQQKREAQESKAELEASKKFALPITTEISPATEFYRAEEYHQDYYQKNSTHYNLYKVGSGRAGFIERTWGEK